STLAASRMAQARTGSYASATNATSHWVWGARAKARHRTDVAHTAVGYGIHHASSLLWACVFERWLATRRPPAPIVAATAITTLAYMVDYHVVPARLTPGFERHLPRRGVYAAYAAFASGLALAALVRRATAASR
ncbi:MAG: hypothetical protein M3Q40_07740, partial [Pseudomonadota bacterium]|nr:hypothetical protein [Pseudomonadota bacterium]